MGYAIAAVVVYVLFLAPRKTEITSTATGARAPTVATGGGQTQISIPGLGTYTNIGGGAAIGISLDGNLLGNLFGGGS